MRRIAIASFVLTVLLSAVHAQSPSPSPASASGASKELTEGREVIMAAYAPLAQKYGEAFAAMRKAGGVSPQGLETKEETDERKSLIEACAAADEDMIKFLNSQPEILRTELAKVSMTPAQIEVYAAKFQPDPETPKLIEIHTLTRQTLKDMSDSIETLGETFGRWQAAEGGRINFKKSADMKKYSGIIDNLRKSTAAQAAAQADLKPNSLESPPPAPTPTPSASPSASPEP